jgi:hypothetical protein
MCSVIIQVGTRKAVRIVVEKLQERSWHRQDNFQTGS